MGGVASHRGGVVNRSADHRDHYSLGCALGAQRKLDQAVAAYRRALQIKPEYPEALLNLGNVLHESGRLDEAVAACREALRQRPRYAEAHFNLGNALRDQGHVDEAVASYRRAVEIRPDFVDAHLNLGITAADRGDLDEAVAGCRKVLALDANYAEAHFTLGNVLQELGHAGEAAESYRRALQIKPDLAEAHNNLGNALRALERFDDAVAALRRAVQLRPEYLEARNSLGTVLYDQGRFEEATAECQEILRIQPGEPLWQLRAASMPCPVILDDADQCDRYREGLLADLQGLAGKSFRPDLARLSVYGSPPPYGLQYHDRNDRPLKEAYAHLFRDGFPGRVATPATGRPRIGFVVTAGHEGIFLKLMRGIVENLDSNEYETFVVCARAGAARIRAAIRNQAVQVLPIPQRFDRIVATIREAAFDLLHYWKVGTDAIDYFLPFCRLAAVQCTSWGVPVTSGIPQMDYYLSSELLEPEEASEHYSEQLVRLATLPTYYERPTRRPAPKIRDDLDLAADRHLYLCPQSLLMLHPDFDRPLAEILRRDPAGQVVLIEARHTRLTELLRQRFSRTMADVADRVRFVPWQRGADFLDLLAACDVMLDPLHFGGANTTYEALAGGTPVVTLPSAFMRGRVTYACYTKMGASECVASDPDDYVAKAVSLAADADLRQSVVERIRETSSALFGDMEAVREYERFFAESIERSRQ